MGVGVRTGQPPAAPTSYARQLGWETHRTDRGTEHSGHYRAPSRVLYRGFVLEESRGNLHFYIHRAPIAWLRLTHFGACFHAMADEWWKISFRPHERPADLDSGIAAVQRALRAAFEARFGNARRRW